VNETIELTRRLVEIPSYDDETEAGDEIEDWLCDETKATAVRDDMGNVLASYDDPYCGEIALVCHHDTVPPDESQLRDGEPVCEEREGRLYGRGTADMKGALACAMLAFRDAGSGTLASFVGEEVGGVGSQHAVKEGFSPKRAVVTEGSRGYSSLGTLDVAVAHRGRREVRVVAHGEAGHAGESSDDDNAIYGATDAINQVRRYETPALELEAGELEAGLTVTEVEGRGSATNVVPSECGFVVDERTVPRREPYGYDFDGAGVEATAVDEMPAMECDDDTFAEGVRDSARETGEGGSELVVKPHATDAGHLARAGVSCVVCGPAERGEAHTDEESVSVEALDRTREAYQRALERF